MSRSRIFSGQEPRDEPVELGRGEIAQDMQGNDHGNAVVFRAGMESVAQRQAEIADRQEVRELLLNFQPRTRFQEVLGASF